MKSKTTTDAGRGRARLDGARLAQTDDPLQREPGQRPCTAFAGARRIASGELKDVALKAKRLVDRGGPAAVLLFDDASGEVIEVDFRGTPAEVRQRLSEPAPRGPGRPRLGVVAREVTLLPRHWDWLGSQPGGASVALRKLVEEARRAHAGKDRVRLAQNAAYRFMTTMAGDAPGFEEALRALFSGRRDDFERRIARWPAGVREHAKKLAAGAFRREATSK
jgi:uncharacterized protein